MNATKKTKTFKFFEYGAPAWESYKQFKCGEDFHCIEGKSPRGDWAKTKKTICNRPAHNFHTDECFSIWIQFNDGKPMVVGGGIPFEEMNERGGQAGLIKKLCPKCLARAKKQA